MSYSIASKEEIDELQQMFQQELEAAYPTYSDYEPPEGTAINSRTGGIEPITDRDQERVDRFAEEFMDELNDPETSKKMMFIFGRRNACRRDARAVAQVD